jgi:glycerate 2-kinase
MKNLINHSQKIIQQAIQSVKPDILVQKKVHLKGSLLNIAQMEVNLDLYKNIFVIGAGKASAVMAQALENILGERITSGCVSVKYHHTVPCKKIRILESGHPLVDLNSIKATGEILQIAQNLTSDDLVICLISGGGSALLESLPENISLKDLQITFDLLLRSGANIVEVNTVRKHISRVKGGQLARAIAPATCISLILSDVIGDPLEAIASGPTAADPTTFLDAWEVMEKYDLIEKLPGPVIAHLEKGRKGLIPDTIKRDDPILKKVKNIILGNNNEALHGAKKAATELGYSTLILTSRVQGEAREVAKVLASVAQEIQINHTPESPPACILMGGETTVTIKGKGKGGRNQELALAALICMAEVQYPYLIVSVGTDGTDGPTDAAGGMAYPEMWLSAQQKQLNPQHYIKNNDSYHFLEITGGLIKIGPSGTNVMDIMFALIP